MIGRYLFASRKCHCNYAYEYDYIRLYEYNTIMNVVDNTFQLYSNETL